MRIITYILLAAFLHISITLSAQTTEQEEEHELSKKELRQQHREEKKAARYEKHHHDDVEESEEVADEEIVPVKTVKKTNVEAEVERALSEHEVPESEKVRSKEIQVRETNQTLPSIATNAPNSTRTYLPLQ